MSSFSCDACGAPLEEGTTFCANCGKSISYNNQSYSSQPMSSAYTQSNYSQNYATPNNQSYYQPQGMYQDARNQPLSVGKYIGMFFLCAIPVAGIVLLFVWAFSSETNINKKNYSRAILLLSAIMIAAYILILLFIAVAFGAGVFSTLN